MGQQLEREQVDAARLIGSFQHGRTEAFDELYRIYFPQLKRMLRAALRDPYEAEDVAQDILLDVLRTLPRFEIDGPPFRGWLMTVAHNRMISVIGTHRHLAVADPAAVTRDLDRALFDDLDELERMADEDFLDLIEWLPLPQRQVLLLRYRFDLAWEEIGQVLGRSSGAVRVLQTRAFELLRPKLRSELGRAQGRSEPGADVGRPDLVAAHA